MKVKIFSIPDCPFCSDLKERLDKKGIEYTDVDVSLEENEAEFETVMEIAGTDHVPCVVIGKHLLAPDVNFYTIEQASNLVSHILENEQ